MYNISDIHIYTFEMTGIKIIFCRKWMCTWTGDCWGTSGQWYYLPTKTNPLILCCKEALISNNRYVFIRQLYSLLPTYILQFSSQVILGLWGPRGFTWQEMIFALTILTDLVCNITLWFLNVLCAVTSNWMNWWDRRDCATCILKFDYRIIRDWWGPQWPMVITIICKI